MAKFLLVGEQDLPRTFVSGLIVDEAPWTRVNTEAELDAALASGRWPHLVGEGTGGVISLTTPKVMPPRTQMRGPAVLQVTFPLGTPAGTTAITGADDVVLENFKLRSTYAVGLATNPFYGIRIPGTDPATGHRMLMKNLEVYNWYRGIIKEGWVAAPYVEDVHVEDCYIHTFAGEGALLWYGLRRFLMKRTRVLGRVGSENHGTQNAVTCGLNVEDCGFEDCEFGNATKMGFESAINNEHTTTNVRTFMRRVLIHDVGGFGSSMGWTVGGLMDDVRVKNANGAGIEFQSLIGEPGNGLIRDCQVENIGPHPEIGNYSVGFSIDGVQDVTLSRPRVKLVTNPTISMAFGIQVIASQRCTVENGDILDGGIMAIHFNRGGSPLNTGYHVAQGNQLRNSFAVANARGIQSSFCTATCRNNTNWQKTGTSLTNWAEGAVVHCDAGAPVGTGFFVGSNQTITVP